MNPSQKAPGKAYRDGISVLRLMEMFPDEGAARKWFESIIWEDGGGRVPPLRRHRHLRGSKRQAAAAPVPQLPQAFFVPPRHLAGELSHWAAKMGDRNLSGGHQPERRVVDEAASGLGNHTEIGLAHAAQDPLCLVGRDAAAGAVRGRGG